MDTLSERVCGGGVGRGRCGRRAAGRGERRLAELLSPGTIDSLFADTEAAGMGLDGAQGLFSQMMKAVLERALQLEMGRSSRL
jgi:hypothetical protein